MYLLGPSRESSKIRNQDLQLNQEMTLVVHIFNEFAVSQSSPALPSSLASRPNHFSVN